MNEHASSGCGNCGQPSLLPLTKDKWGKCPLCIALALAGAVTGWSFTLSFGLLSPDKRIVLGSACVSLFFTVVLLLHAIAYRRRVSQSPPSDINSMPR